MNVIAGKLFGSIGRPGLVVPPMESHRFVRPVGAAPLSRQRPAAGLFLQRSS